jgi:hypothetical protein
VVTENMRRIVVEQRLDDHDLISVVCASGAFRYGVARFLAWARRRDRLGCAPVTFA